MMPATCGSPTGLVFISGGSALNSLARLLATSGLEAVHIIAVFDNGGSTAQLRPFCDIAIGDIRNRLTAIGGQSSGPSKLVVDLFSARLHGNKPRHLMRKKVEEIARGNSELLSGIPENTCLEVSRAVSTLLGALPRTFDWDDCSIGNLILVGRYLAGKNWDTTLEWAHNLVSACGLVLPTTTESAHLGARLRNDTSVVGQSRLTDEKLPIRSPIERLLLHPTDKSSAKAARVPVYARSRAQLESARAIVYSWGSFYTSVLSAFLVDGLPDAVLGNEVPKVLLLNPSADAETLGKKPADLVQELCHYAQARASKAGGKTVTHVLAIRSSSGSIPQFYDEAQRTDLENMGIEVIEVECADDIPRSQELRMIAQRLLTLAGTQVDE
jgi:CofD-related protein of GAK system